MMLSQELLKRNRLDEFVSVRKPMEKVFFVDVGKKRAQVEPTTEAREHSLIRSLSGVDYSVDVL